MAKEFDSIQSLLKQVHGHGDAKGPAPVEISQEERIRDEEAKLRAAVAKFKDDILADKGLQKRLQKFRREGIYAIRPIQWVGIVIGLPLIVAIGIYSVHFASSVTRSNLAIKRGVEQIYADNVSPAMANLDQALALGAAKGATLLKFARALRDVGYKDSAVQLFDRAGDVGRQTGDYGTMVEAASGAGEILLEMSRFEDAEERVHPIIRIDPKERQPLLIQGRIYFAQSRFAEAEQSFINSLERNPVSLTPRFYLRETYLKMGRLEDARQQEEFLLYTRPSGDEDFNTLIGYGDLMIRQGMLDEAEKILVRVLNESRRALPQIMVTLGHLAIEKQDLAKAELYADSAVTAAPNDPNGYILRSELHYHYGRGREALADLNKALSLDPLNAKALYNMGSILFYDLGMTHQALAHFHRSIEQGFDGPYIWYNIGTAHLLLKNAHEAAKAYEKMRPSLMNSNDVKWAMGNAYLLDHQSDTALAIFKELRATREDDPGLENNIGVLNEVMGETAAAQKQYWRAINSSKEEGRDTIALENINRLLAGRPPSNLWQAIHLDVPLKPRGLNPVKIHKP